MLIYYYQLRRFVFELCSIESQPTEREREREVDATLDTHMRSRTADDLLQSSNTSHTQLHAFLQIPHAEMQQRFSCLSLSLSMCMCVCVCVRNFMSDKTLLGLSVCGLARLLPVHSLSRRHD